MITLYTIPETCPKCKEVKGILQARCIPFEEIDLMQISAKDKADFICEKGYPPMAAPIMRIGNIWLAGDEITDDRLGVLL